MPPPNAPDNWPKPAVSTAVFRNGKVLLIERGKGALKGRWSLPGGHIEPAEPIRVAALREILEETGVTAELVGLAEVHDVIVHDPAGALAAHYVLSVFCGRWRSGEPLAASDAAAARFVSFDEIASLPTSDGLERIVRSAARQLEQTAKR